MGILGAIAGGLIANKGAKDAASAQSRAANDQLSFNRETRDMVFDRYEPFYQQGQNALEGYGYELGMGPRPEGYGGFTATPGYDFRMQQGQEAIQSAAGLRGGINSGRTAQDLMGFGQGIASQEYGNYLNRLAGMTDMGMSAAGGQANAATNANTGAASAYSNLGNAQSAGSIGQANAWNGALGNIGGIMQYQKNMGGGGGNFLGNLAFPGGLFGGPL